MEELKDNKTCINWSTSIERNIKEIGEKAKGYKIMHIQESRNINQKYNWLMYSCILLGPVSGLLSGVGSILNSDAPTTFPILSACTAFISGILVAITKFGKFEETVSHHKIAASKYTSLESNVRRQLILSRVDRIEAAQYLNWVGNSFDDLFLASPLVDKSIYENYVKVAKSHGIIIPDEYEITISINDEYQTQKKSEIKDISLITVNNDDTGSVNIHVDDSDGVIKRSETFKGLKKINRTESMSNFEELNKFSDGRMEYEMRRLIGIK